MSDEVSFLVYGSYLGNWRVGLSDLDGIIYFRRRLPLDIAIRPNILAFQKEIRKLYQEIDFLKEGRFFADVFVLDYLHASDCRFVVFDEYFVPFNPKRAGGFGREVGYKMFLGPDFVDILRPHLVLLADSKELELAFGLQKLRNYLLFEIPRPALEVSPAYQKEVAKCLKILPRNVKFILDESTAVSPQNLNSVRKWLGDIDYAPLAGFVEACSSPEKLEEFLSGWHKSDDQTFIRNLECFEKTLERLVKNAPKKSRT